MKQSSKTKLGWFLASAMIAGIAAIVILSIPGTFIAPESELGEVGTQVPPKRTMGEGFVRSQARDRVRDVTAISKEDERPVDLRAVPASYPFDPQVGLPALSGIALSCESPTALLSYLRADQEVIASAKKLDLAAVERALEACRESVELYKQACAVYQAGYGEWRRQVLAAGTVRRCAGENEVNALLQNYKGRDKTAMNFARIHLAEPDGKEYVVAVADPYQDLMLYGSYANVAACGVTVADCLKRSALAGN